jgi:hypothetical protein
MLDINIHDIKYDLLKCKCEAQFIALDFKFDYRDSIEMCPFCGSTNWVEVNESLEDREWRIAGVVLNDAYAAVGRAEFNKCKAQEYYLSVKKKQAYRNV